MPPKRLDRLTYNVPHVKIYLDEGQNEAQGSRDHDHKERVEPDPGIGGALSIHSLGIHSQGNHSDDKVGHKQQQEEHLLSAAPTHISRLCTPCYLPMSPPARFRVMAGKVCP